MTNDSTLGSQEEEHNNAVAEHVQAKARGRRASRRQRLFTLKSIRPH
jgi:hypothetical protein